MLLPSTQDLTAFGGVHKGGRSLKCLGGGLQLRIATDLFQRRCFQERQRVLDVLRSKLSAARRLLRGGTQRMGARG